MKAILVIDEMPNSCEKCEVRCDGYTAKEYKECIEKGIKRPSWCPLKPMPDIKTKEAIKLANMINPKAIFQEFADGWNACLEEIEK